MNCYDKLAQELSKRCQVVDEDGGDLYFNLESAAALLRSHIAPLVTELRETEWFTHDIYFADEYRPVSECPVCGGEKPNHKAACARQLALAQWTE